MAPRVRPIREFVYEMGQEPIHGVVHDIGGAVIDVVTKGADSTGTNDSTDAINAALTDAGLFSVTPRYQGRTVFFPPGQYKTSGGHVIPTGVSVRGAGTGATIINLTHASNDLFTFSGQHSNHLELSDMRVISPDVTRTGGWVFKGSTSFAFSYSRIDRLFIQNQVNGIWLPKFNYSWVSDVMMDTMVASSGTGMRFGQPSATVSGVNLHVSGCEIADFATALSVGILLEDCDAVYMNDTTSQAINNALKLSAGTYGIHNCEFHDFISDQTSTSHSTYITGAGAVADIKFEGCWFAFAGGAAGGAMNGMRIDVTTVANALQIEGCNFALNRGTGLYISTNAAPVLVNGCQFSRNGGAAAAANKDSIFVNTGAGARAPHIVGNFCNGVLAGGEFSIRTSATSDQLTVVGNRWVSGTSYGVAPLLNTANV